MFVNINTEVEIASLPKRLTRSLKRFIIEGNVRNEMRISMTENFSEIINEETAPQKLLQWSGEYERTCGHKPLALIHSYGCQQNVSDGEKIKGMLSKVGYDFTSDVNEAQLILYNTCAVRENAEDKVFGKLGDLKHLKENNPELIIGICGCMAQQKHVAEKIKKTYRQVDLVFGTFAYNDMYNMLWEIISKHDRIFNLSENHVDINEDFLQLRDDKIRAFVPIMYGCNNFCTYCIVPYVRGRERSRKPESVIRRGKSTCEKRIQRNNTARSERQFLQLWFS